MDVEETEKGEICCVHYDRDLIHNKEMVPRKSKRRWESFKAFPIVAVRQDQGLAAAAAAADHESRDKKEMCIYIFLEQNNTARPNFYKILKELRVVAA